MSPEFSNRGGHSADVRISLILNGDMSGKPGDAAFVDIRSIGGLTGDVKRELSKQLCKLLTDSLGVAPDRVYLNFTELNAGNWGWNGSTFG